jgi:hypothetical protein
MTKRKKVPVESDMEDFMHQPNLDQDEHDKWLESQTSEEMGVMVSRLGKLFRSKEQAGKLAPEPTGDLGND